MADQPTTTSTGTPSTSGGTPPQAGPGGEMLFFFAAMMIVVYVLIWRPESRRRKEKEALLASLKAKDKVITIGGLHGTVVDIDGDDVVLLADPKKDVKLKFRRSAIESVQSEEKKS